MASPTTEHGHPQRCTRAGLHYLAHGWSVIPLAPGDKRPLIRWRELQGRRADEDELRAWLRRWPDANLGIVTGAVSALVVLDIDPGHGGDQSLAAIERETGESAQTLTAISGGGGRHLYFRHPGTPVANRCGLRPGMDLRGDGGYIVAPPSTHSSGNRYRWVRETAGLGLAPLPGWLRPATEQRGATRSREAWRTFVRGGVGLGQRNNGIASLAGHLLHRDVDPGVVLELLLSWNESRCDPPLSADEVARTLASIQRTRRRHGQSPERVPAPRSWPMTLSTTPVPSRDTPG